ncbi:MAG TPA: hypothetical protein VHD37_01880 [Candidatus Paceibacterota bacterium]|nr:hypothetical protein [Candidatus Paceibacterota bacterium]
MKRRIALSHEVLEFLGTVIGTPQDVYRQDIKEHASQCDLLLAICDYPAVGVGYEMAYAIEKRGIPTLAVAHEKAQVSRLVIGIDHPCYTFARYQNMLRDVPRLLEEKIESVAFDQVGVTGKRAFGAHASD